MTEMQILHKMLCKRLEMLEDALDASRDQLRTRGLPFEKHDTEFHCIMEKNIGRFQEVHMIIKEMERIDPTCTQWEN